MRGGASESDRVEDDEFGTTQNYARGGDATRVYAVLDLDYEAINFLELLGSGGLYFCRGLLHFQIMSKFSIVLLRPEIPHNTGAIGRLCVGLGVKLNLVRPLGFHLDDRAIERAGLDYWVHLELAIHDTWEDYLKSERPRRFFFLSTHGTKSLYDLQFEEGDALVFGNESSGLPKDFYSTYKDDLFRIPMPGSYARSINLANAVSIAAYECYRQLR